METDADPTTEQRIIRAARAAFMRRGFDGARMQDIADSAGINKAMLHYYFRSKKRLFDVVFQDVLRRFHDAFVEVLESNLGFLEKIRTMVERDIDTLLENPDVPLFVVSEIARHPIDMSERGKSAGMPDLITEFGRQVRAAVEAREIRPVDPTDLLLNILALNRFPFIARRFMAQMAGLSESTFDDMMIRRKESVADLLINDLVLHD